MAVRSLLLTPAAVRLACVAQAVDPQAPAGPPRAVAPAGAR